MPQSRQATSNAGGEIPSDQSIILLLPTDAHPDLWTDNTFGEWTTSPLHGGTQTLNPITGEITYDETIRERTASDFGDEVYVNTISGLEPKTFLDEADKEVLRKLYYETRRIYRQTETSVNRNSTQADWDEEQITAYTNAFHTAVRKFVTHGQCQSAESCPLGTCTRSSGTLQPSKSALGDLAVIPRVVTAESLVAISRNPSFYEPAYNFHTIKPLAPTASSVGPSAASRDDTARGIESEHGLSTNRLPPDMVIFGSGAL